MLLALYLAIGSPAVAAQNEGDFRNIHQNGDVITEPRHIVAFARRSWMDLQSDEDRTWTRNIISEIARNPVYLTYQVSANNGTLTRNIEAYLNNLVKIKRRSFVFYRKKIIEEITRAVQVYGYYHPQITVKLADEADFRNGLVYVEVERGTPVTIEKINVSYGVDSRVEKLLKDLEVKNKIVPGQKFTHVRYESYKSDILANAISRGYLKARITESRAVIYKDENKAEIFLTLDPGVRYKIGRINYIGFDEAQDMAARLSPLKQGAYLDTDDMVTYSQKLYQSGYFQSADVSLDYDHINWADMENVNLPINVRLSRKPYTLAEVGLGFSTDENVRFQLSHRNPWINNYGHSFNSRLKVSSVNSFVEGNYIIPHNDPINDYYRINASYEHKDNDDTLYDSFLISGHYVINDPSSWDRDYFVEYGYDDFVQGSNDGWSSLIMPGISLSRTRMDSPIDPAFGYRVTVTFKTSLEKLLSTERISYADIVLKGLFAPTKDSRVLLRYEQGFLIGGSMSSIPPRLRFFAGGDQSIRGFGFEKIAPEDSGGNLLGGRYMSVGSAELQVPVSENLRLATFLDGGVVTNDYRENTDLKMGTGFGIRYLSPVGAIRLDLGFGISEVHMPIKLHFGIGPGL
ncbi:MAG: autotransporter assembly complex family protein [Succinivibrionaceae bacterium]